MLAANGQGVVLTRILSGTTPTSRGQIRIDDNWIGLTPDGRCQACGTAIAGRFETFTGQFGRRRIPVRAMAP